MALPNGTEHREIGIGPSRWRRLSTETFTIPASFFRRQMALARRPTLHEKKKRSSFPGLFSPTPKPSRHLKSSEGCNTLFEMFLLLPDNFFPFKVDVRRFFQRLKSLVGICFARWSWRQVAGKRDGPDSQIAKELARQRKMTGFVATKADC